MLPTAIQKRAEEHETELKSGYELTMREDQELPLKMRTLSKLVTAAQKWAEGHDTEYTAA